MTIQEHLISINACKSAQNWVADKKTGQECWDATDRVDWLFWWAAQTGQKKQVVICAKIIADSVSHLKNVYAAADAAAHAAHAAHDAHDAYAADNADEATYAAHAAAHAAHAAYTAYATYAAYRKQKSLNLKIARENLTCPFPG